MTRNRIVIAGLVLGLLLAVAAVAGYAYSFTGVRPSPARLGLSSPSASAAASPAARNLVGRWTVARNSVVRYRVKEQFVGQTSPHEAVAETSEVTGGFDVQQASGALPANGVNVVTHLS